MNTRQLLDLALSDAAPDSVRNAAWSARENTSDTPQDMTLTWDTSALPTVPRHVPVRKLRAPVVNPPWLHDSRVDESVDPVQAALDAAREQGGVL